MSKIRATSSPARDAFVVQFAEYERLHGLTTSDR